MVKILSSSFLKIQEIDLFKYYVKWVEHHKPEKQSLDEMIALIRFPMMSPKDLFKTVKPSKLVPSPIYIEAQEYHLVPEEFDKAQLRFNPRVNKSKSKPVSQLQQPCTNCGTISKCSQCNSVLPKCQNCCPQVMCAACGYCNNCGEVSSCSYCGAPPGLCSYCSYYRHTCNSCGYCSSCGVCSKCHSCGEPLQNCSDCYGTAWCVACSYCNSCGTISTCSDCGQFLQACINCSGVTRCNNCNEGDIFG